METVKLCKKCSVVKGISLFGNDKRAGDGKQWKCKECVKTALKQWKQNNHDKLLKQYKRRHAREIIKNAPLIKEKQRLMEDIRVKKEQELQKDKKERAEQRRRALKSDSRNIRRRRRYRALKIGSGYASQILNAAVNKGELTRPDICSCCGLPGKIDGHHEDYSKPLDVVWLRRECHLLLHNHLWKRGIVITGC